MERKEKERCTVVVSHVCVDALLVGPLHGAVLGQVLHRIDNPADLWEVSVSARCGGSAYADDDEWFHGRCGANGLSRRYHRCRVGCRACEHLDLHVPDIDEFSDAVIHGGGDGRLVEKLRDFEVRFGQRWHANL